MNPRGNDAIVAAIIAVVALAISPPGIEWLTGRPVLTPRITAVSLIFVAFLLVAAAAALLRGRPRRIAFYACAWIFPLVVLAGLETVAIATHLADRIAPVENNSSLKNWQRWPGYMLSDARFADQTGDIRLYRPWQGDGVVINQLGLRTAMPTPRAPGEWRVAITGGSAVWGYRVLDADTIPAQVQDILRHSKPNVTVYNFGIEGALNSAELALLKHFRATYQIDQVIFYTGGNDVIAPYLPSVGDAKGLGWMSSEKTGFELVKIARRLNTLWSGPSATTLARFDHDIVEPTLRKDPLRVSIAGAVDYCRREKLRCDFILQPQIFTRKNPPPPEARLVYTMSRFYPRMDILGRRLFAEVTTSGLPGLHDFSSVFDGDQDVFFIDSIHLNEAGNRRVAEQIAKVINIGPEPAGAR